MSYETDTRDPGDVGPGFMDAAGLTIREGIARYAVGFVLASALTAASFYVLNTSLIWGPGIPVALVVLAIAQIGVHLVFFLHSHDSSRQHQQRAGAGVRRADRRAGDRRLAVDHG